MTKCEVRTAVLVMVRPLGYELTLNLLSLSLSWQPRMSSVSESEKARDLNCRHTSTRRNLEDTWFRRGKEPRKCDGNDANWIFKVSKARNFYSLK